MTTTAFTSTDQGLRPVELEGVHMHARCAEAEGLNDRIVAWHGEYRFADHVMDHTPNRSEHEFLCPLCMDLFPQIVIDGEWI